MTFSRTNTWANRTLLTSTQINNMDLNITRAVDGYAGGTYAPSSAIVIGGSGLSVTGAAAFSGSFAGASAAFSGTVDVSVLQVSGLSAFSSVASFHAGISVDTIASAFASAIVFSSTGRVLNRITTGSNADSTYTINDTSTIYIPSTLTANRIYTIGETGASNGDELTIFMDSACTFNVQIIRADASTICNLEWGVSGTDLVGRGCRLVRANSKWQLAMLWRKV